MLVDSIKCFEVYLVLRNFPWFFPSSLIAVWFLSFLLPPSFLREQSWLCYYSVISWLWSGLYFCESAGPVLANTKVSKTRWLCLVFFLLNLSCGHSLILDTHFPSLTCKDPSLAFLFLESLAILLSLLCKYFLFLYPPEMLLLSRVLVCGWTHSSWVRAPVSNFQPSCMCWWPQIIMSWALEGTCKLTLGLCSLWLHQQRHHWFELLEQSSKCFFFPSLFIYFEKEGESEQGRGRERERENPK